MQQQRYLRPFALDALFAEYLHLLQNPKKSENPEMALFEPNIVQCIAICNRASSASDQARTIASYQSLARIARHCNIYCLRCAISYHLQFFAIMVKARAIEACTLSVATLNCIKLIIRGGLHQARERFKKIKCPFSGSFKVLKALGS